MPPPGGWNEPLGLKGGCGLSPVSQERAGLGVLVEVSIISERSTKHRGPRHIPHIPSDPPIAHTPPPPFPLPANDWGYKHSKMGQMRLRFYSPVV